MARSFIVRVNNLRWLQDERVINMLRCLPFDFGILSDIMIDCFLSIERGDSIEAYEAIVDRFYAYDIDDDVLQNQQFMPIQDVMHTTIIDGKDIWCRDALQPWCDLVVEVVLSLHADARGQLLPIFNDVTLATHTPPSYGGPAGVNAILVTVGDDFNTAAFMPSVEILPLPLQPIRPFTEYVAYETPKFSGAL